MDGSTSDQSQRAASRSSSSCFFVSGSASASAKRPPLNWSSFAMKKSPPSFIAFQSDRMPPGKDAGLGIQYFSSASVKSRSGRSPTSSANMVKMARIRNFATRSAGCFDSSSILR